VRLLKIAVSFAALAYCLTLVDAPRLSAQFANVRPPLLVTAIALVLVETVVGAVRFKLMLDPMRALPLVAHVRQYFVASYFNLLLPSSMGGDGARIVMLRRRGAAGAAATAMVLAERAIGAYTLLVVSAVAALISLAAGTLDAHIATPIGLALIVATVAGGIALVAVSRIATPSAAGTARARIDVALGALATLRAHPLRTGAAVLVSVVYQVLTVTVTLLVAVAFELDVAPLHVFAFVPLVWIATLVPIGIGGGGIRELAFVALFGLVATGEEASLVLSLGTYLTLVVPAVIGAVWALADDLRHLK